MDDATVQNVDEGGVRHTQDVVKGSQDAEQPTVATDDGQPQEGSQHEEIQAADVLNDAYKDVQATNNEAKEESESLNADVAKVTAEDNPLSKDTRNVQGSGGDDETPAAAIEAAPSKSATPPTPPEKSNVEEAMQKAENSTANSSATTALKPETVQHRQDSNGDKPSAYVPVKPATYMQIKALALQMPNITNFANQSSSHNVDPPVLIVEARTNLSSARRSFYPRVTRSLPELQLWILALTLSFPAAIFSPFTYPPSSLAGGGSAEDAAIRSYLSTVTKQFGRILGKPYVLSHPATVALVDCDFSYNPGMPHVGPGSSVSVRRKLDDGMALARSGHDPLRGRRGKSGAGQAPTSSWDVDGVAAALGLPSLPSQASGDTYAAPASSSNKGPLSIFSRANASPQRIQPQPSVPIPPGEEDQDEEELTAARNEITRLELQFEKASQAAHSLVERNGAMTATLHQLNAALTDLAKLDEGRTVARKKRESDDVAALTKGIEAWTSAQAGSNVALMSTIVPSMSYQSLNARSAIDALLRRAAAATHRHSALVVLVQKRREAERLKRARGEIRQEDVDWVLQELRDAQRTTHVLTHHLSTFTATLKEELKEHSRNTHSDIQESLLQHARSSIRAQKFMLNNIVRARDALVSLREGKTSQIHDGAEAEPVSAAVKTDVDVEETVQTEVATEAGEEPAEPSLADRSEAEVPISDTTVPEQPPRIDDKADVVEESSITTTSEPIVADSADEEGGSLVVPASKIATKVDSNEPLLTPEPSPWGQEEAPPLTSNASWTVPPSASTQVEAEPSPWGDEETAQASIGTTAQSTFLPPRMADPFQDDDEAAIPAAPTMSQSAFLPGRDMSRYANPFARMDGGSVNGANPSLGPGGRPTNPLAGGGGGGPFANNAGKPGGGATSGSSQQPGKPPSKDPWANRSRISASDAARSLAGRF